MDAVQRMLVADGCVCMYVCVCVCVCVRVCADDVVTADTCHNFDWFLTNRLPALRQEAVDEREKWKKEKEAHDANKPPKIGTIHHNDK